VDKFMSEQLPAGTRAWGVSIWRKHHMVPDSVSVRTDGLCRLAGLLIAVYPHPAEVVTETFLHDGARRSFKRLAGGLQNFIDDRRRPGNFLAPRRLPLALRGVAA